VDTQMLTNANAAIAKTIVDAKGDIIAATGADAVSRLVVGANDTILTADSTTATGLKWAAAAGGAVNSNKVINGNFAINQRAYVSAATLASGVYGLDRWKSNIAGTTLTFTAAVNGNQLTINSTGGIQQVVEREVIPAGDNTLSWEGTATARMYNSGAGAPSYAASPITVNLDGLANVVLEFTADGATKTLANVKLEAGTTASAFVLAGLTAAGEFAACQRHYFQPATSFNGAAFCQQSGIGATAVFDFPVTMRATPTGTYNSVGITIHHSGGSAASTAVTTSTSNTKNFAVGVTVASGLTAGAGMRARTNAAGAVKFDSEL